MASLLDLLSQRQPNLQTRKGLLLTGLQNDFLSANGKLPVSSDYDYIGRIKTLAPLFRDYGDVIWVRSQYEADRMVTNGLHETGDSVITGPLEEAAEVNDAGSSTTPATKARKIGDGADVLVDNVPPSRATTCDEVDEELFLINTAQRQACCMKGTTGADFAPQIMDIIDSKDLQVLKSYYSAFGSTSLLLTLRSKLITELFIGGNMTNLSVFATAVDAARYGIKITLLEDCLGYRNKSRHDAAIQTLKDIMGADVVTAAQAIETLKNPPIEDPTDDEEEASESEADDVDGTVTFDRIAKHASEDKSVDIDIDSDEEEEEEEEFELLPIVRETLASASRLPSRLVRSTAETAGLQEPASGKEHAPSLRELQSIAGSQENMSNHTGQATTESNITSVHKRLATGSDRPSDRNPNCDVKTDESPNKVSLKASLHGGQTAKPINVELSRKSNDQSITPAQSTKPGLHAIARWAGLDKRKVNEYEDMMKASKDANTDHEREQQAQPLFGEDKKMESAGSRILYDLLPADMAETIFDRLKDEVKWQTMHHQTGEVPRLVCCQGTTGEDGRMPVYRHPSDQTLPITTWSPTVDSVRVAAEAVAGHSLNHALIQLYRGGTDFISEHSDKTLDIAKDSSIVNVSFGAQRTMRLRAKRGAAASVNGISGARTTYRVPMPHNSMITMSLPTNAEYLHGIMANKRPRVEMSEAETAFEGQRISITFRNIATFLDRDSTRIWGQGATGKTHADAKPVINGDAAESERMVRAFGAENQASSIDWKATYGDGFDTLHLR